jgi:hypothetical protein
MAITTININKEGQKNTVADYSSCISYPPTEHDKGERA